MAATTLPTDAQLHDKLDILINYYASCTFDVVITVLSEWFGGVDLSPKAAYIRKFLRENECDGTYGLRDLEHDPDADPSRLRFAVGTQVMYKTEGKWFEGIIVACCKKVRCDKGSCTFRFPYVVEKRPYIEDDLPELIRFDADEYIKPRMSDKSLDPSKFKPKLAVPEDPMHILYSDMAPFNSKTEEGANVADLLEKMNIADGRATTNPDGSIYFKQRGTGKEMSLITVKNQGYICGVDYPNVMMYVNNHIIHRFPVGHHKGVKCHDHAGILKSVAPEETDLHELEWKAKNSPWKMLQLADALMLGMNGWTKNYVRACKLYRAAAWGCSEEEMLMSEAELGLDIRFDIPNGPPEAMIQAANICILGLKSRLGFDNSPQSRVISVEEWIVEGLRSRTDLLLQVFFWIHSALKLHGWVTSLTILVARGIRETQLIHDVRRLCPAGTPQGILDLVKSMLQKIVDALEYRDKQVDFEKMQQKGKVPRGDPSPNTLGMFMPKASCIFKAIPIVSESMHIEFRQVPRSPYPIVAIAFYPFKKKIQKIVFLPADLQMTPYSKESFDYTLVQILFDLHLGTLGTGARVRPNKITVPNNHGNDAFASFLENVLQGSGTKVQLVMHTDKITVGKHKTTIGQLTSEIMEKCLSIPGAVGFDAVDVVARAQEDFVDHFISEQVCDDEIDSSTFHSDEATKMKVEGNRHFIARDYGAAIRCYSIALGHLRRVIDHNSSTHNLLGTILSNRANCLLCLVESESVSLEFRVACAGNAISDCTHALDSSWLSSLPQTIVEKLQFRLSKATASFDTLNQQLSLSLNNDSDGHGSLGLRSTESKDEATIQQGEVVFKNHLAKNAEDGCPICLREFNEELAKTYSVVLPCKQHALCVNCICSLKIEADAAKECPRCPLCRDPFDQSFVECIPGQLIENDNILSSLILKLPIIDLGEKVAISERLLWAHRFDLSSVIDVIESLLDGQLSDLFFRDDLTCEGKDAIYTRARVNVKKLERDLEVMLDQQRSTFDAKDLNKINCKVGRLRNLLVAARQEARDEIYNRIGSVSDICGDEDGRSSLIKVDYHGMHVSEMRNKFHQQVIPILPVVKKVLVLTGRSGTSTENASKLNKALFKLISQNEVSMYCRPVNENEEAFYVFWRE